MSQRREGGRFRTWSTSPFRGREEIEESPKRQEETQGSRVSKKTAISLVKCCRKKE